MRRHELTDFEWKIIEPLLPNKPRGVPRVNDRRVLNGILWRVRTGSPWRDIPERYGPSTTCYNRFVRWRVGPHSERGLGRLRRGPDHDRQLLCSRPSAWRER
jgi:transposase